MTGVILAGGKGSRIGANKALIRIGEKHIIELIAERTKGLFKETIIVGDLVPQEILSHLKHIEDMVEGKGPLGGIYTGLINSTSEYNFVFACDMPSINTDLVRYMMSECEWFDAAVPKTRDGPHPLHAIYSKSCLPFIEAQISEGDLKVSNLFSKLKVKYIRTNLSFYNINTRQDLEQAIEQIRK